MKILLTSLATIALLFILALSASAGTGPGYSLNNLAPFSWYNPNNESGDLYLYAKDSSTWEVINGAGRAKIHHNVTGTEFEYEMAGFNLDANTDYELIYYPDPWPGDGLICLGGGISDDGGKVYMTNSLDTGDLPRIYDWNHSDNDGYSETTRDGGAKIWLVLKSDVDCGSQRMIGWNPSKYLFEDEVITFDDSDYEYSSIDLCYKSTSTWLCLNGPAEGSLVYVNSWPNFDYTFSATGVEHSTNYSLIYFADGWPGNYPGALIGTGDSDSSGNVLLSGYPDLGIDMPDPLDANFTDGAKIWLVPSSLYNSITKSVTSYTPNRFLFEAGWVNYDDSNN